MEDRIVINVYVGCGKPEVVRRRRRKAIKLAKKLEAEDVILREVDGPAPRSAPEGFEIVKDPLLEEEPEAEF